MSEILPEVPATLTPLTRAQLAVIAPVAGVIHRRPPRHMKRILQRLSAGARPATYDEAKRARDEILTASAKCRGGSACLIRSLSVALLCRLRGTWPTWCVGVLAVPPFAAHAWIEADGEIVDEPLGQRDYRTFFKVSTRVQESESQSRTRGLPGPDRAQEAPGRKTKTLSYGGEEVKTR